MKTSESIKELAAALCNVQAALEPARFNANNPFFKSKYADLNSVFDACRHLMADNGLSLVQFPGAAPIEAGPAVALTSRLMHQSGEWLEDTMIIPLAKATPQDYGSALTYARRYAVSAIIGIVADEDDDGNRAQGQEVSGRNVTKNPVPEVQQNTHGLKKGDEVLITGKDDEVLGTYQGTIPNKKKRGTVLYTVTIDGKDFNVSPDKVKPVASEGDAEQGPLFDDNDTADTGAYAE